VWLYSVVFTSRVSAAVIILLLLSFFVQPINQAVAAPEDESISTSADSVADEVREQIIEKNDVPPESTETEIISDTLVDDVTQNNSESLTAEINDETATTSTEIETDIEQSTETSSTTNDVEQSDQQDTEDIPTQSIEQIVESSDDADQEVASTSTSTPPVVQAQNLTTEDNFYQFSRQSCVQVGGGTYHCSINDVSDYDTQSVVYAASDSEGDMEIFLRTLRGDVRQLTDNQFEDTAPYYDSESLQVVWQRLIDDRYQIISYDISSGKESQLTYSRTNNMEPKVSNEGIVWQAWDSNDWEIMYFDGSYTEQITDNAVQDVNPVIQDGYILWSVIGRSAQEAKVYSLKSKEILTITGHEGGTIVNPRFVLVYDTQFDNGDVITKGFDPVTGLSAPIAAQAAPEPVDIPPIDPIGEIRALIQNKSTSEEEQEFDELPNLDSDTLTIGSTTDKVITSDTLDLKNPSTIAPTRATTSSIVLSEFDLVISASETNSSSTESSQ